MLFSQPLWIDFSWLLFRNWHSRGGLGIDTSVMEEGGVPHTEFRPTGHIFGCVKDIATVAKFFPEVILALDGGKQYRRDMFPGYKSGRKALEYPIFDDLPAIVRLTSYLPNVKFAFRKNYEADDLVSTAVASQQDIVMWTRDRDLMQTRGNWRVLDDIFNGEPRLLDLVAYIEKGTASSTKQGLLGFDFLPCWYKIVRGDPSDKIPGGIPFLRHNVLLKLVIDLASTQKLEDLLQYLKDELKYDAEKIEKLRPGLDLNLRLITPRYITDREPFIFKTQTSKEEALNSLADFQFNSLYAIFFPEMFDQQGRPPMVSEGFQQVPTI